LFLGVIVFTLMYVWMLMHRQRVLTLHDMMDDVGLDVALQARRAEAGVS
jgi:heme exporter protein C